VIKKGGFKSRVLALIAILVVLAFIVYKAQSLVEYYFLIDAEFQNDMAQVLKNNNELDKQQLIAMFEITKGRELESGIIIKLLDYLLLFFLISLVVLITEMFCCFSYRASSNQ